jgi:hypothetical protein
MHRCNGKNGLHFVSVFAAGNLWWCSCGVIWGKVYILHNLWSTITNHLHMLDSVFVIWINITTAVKCMHSQSCLHCSQHYILCPMPYNWHGIEERHALGWYSSGIDQSSADNFWHINTTFTELKPPLTRVYILQTDHHLHQEIRTYQGQQAKRVMICSSQRHPRPNMASYDGISLNSS